MTTIPRQAISWKQTPGRSGGISWPGDCFFYSVNEQGSKDMEWETLLEVVRKSFRTWQEVTCSGFTFEETAPATVDKAEFNLEKGNANLIVWRESTWDEMVDGELVRRDPDIVALTSVMYDQNTDQIMDADIELNGVFYQYAILTGAPGDEFRMDLQGVLTHEIGHTVGLDHSTVSGVVMAPYGGPGETSIRTLKQDDIDGLCSIYPTQDGADICEAPYCGLDLTGESTTCDNPRNHKTDDGKCSVAPRRASLGLLWILGWALWS
ncbi:MAG: matrixin family metalloprotease [Myxococcota bacterium]|nr:matrixin family metalloprotease [Myxococcota bacterium]